MGKPLVIVESPTKAKTISKFLGDEFSVESSIGHIRDLPSRASDVPKSKRGEKWTSIGVNVEDNFTPLYVLTHQGQTQVKKLKQLLKSADILYLATDEDREGEAIAWHLAEVLKPKVPVKRMVFHEITQRAIESAIEDARDLNMNLVHAQETRRIVDRLFGYNVSPVLWRKIRPKLSAGRVQSIAVRLIVNRELGRMDFVSSQWWDLQARFHSDAGDYPAKLTRVNGKPLATHKDFDSSTGQLKKSDCVLLDEKAAQALSEEVLSSPGKILRLDRTPFVEKPPPPFTTSTLQQEANKAFQWPISRTMRNAQSLYENGWISYIRTDSISLSGEATQALRSTVESEFGAGALSSAPRLFKTKSKSAQEAHEAIRPATEMRSIEACRRAFRGDEAKLYEMIWRRSLACQMRNCEGERIALETECGSAIFRSAGREILQQGFRSVYKSRAKEDAAKLLPKGLRVGLEVKASEMTPTGHNTQPPSRLTEAALVKDLESRGIGRPSTYSSIVETILDRGYIFRKGNALVPSWTAFAVNRLMEVHFAQLVDYEFTARLEDGLDSIAIGENEPLGYLQRFWSDETQGLEGLIKQAVEEADPRSICSIQLGVVEGKELKVRVGRYGPFIESDGSTASLPEDMPPDELSLEVATTMLQKGKEGPLSLGLCPDTELEVFLCNGRYGSYLQLGPNPETKPGKKSKEKPPKRVSLLKGMEPAEMTLELALRLLALPRVLGQDKDGADVTAQIGKFGPYIRAGKATASIPPTLSVLDIQLAEAMELISKKPARGSSKKVLKDLGQDEEGRSIQVLEGRYGPYVTDGKTNATIKKDTDPLTVSLETAVEMLEIKRKQPKKGRRKRR